MTRQPGLDDRTIDWLCEGPERAPDWVLSGADAYARSHPRRRLWAWRSGRSLMSHLHLVRPEEDAGARRVSRAWAGFGVVALTAVLVVGAFGVGARWGRGEPPAGGIGVPSAAPGSVAPANGQVALSATCAVATGHADTQSGGVTRSRGGQLRCDTASADPRLAGTMSIFWSADRRADGTGETWGEATLRAGDGRWAGSFSGLRGPRRHIAPDRCVVRRQRLLRRASRVHAGGHVGGVRAPGPRSSRRMRPRPRVRSWCDA